MKLTKSIKKLKLDIQREGKASQHINIAGHYDENTLIDKDGKLIQLFRVRGIDPITQDNETLNTFKRRLNSLLKSINSHYALYTWTIRKKGQSFPEGSFGNNFAKSVNDKYRAKIESEKLFYNELYIALVTKSPIGKIHSLHAWFNSLSHQFDQKARDIHLKKIHSELIKISNKIVSGLQEYLIEQLNVYTDEGSAYSSPLTLVSALINGDEYKTPLLPLDAARCLIHHRLFFNAKRAVIEIRRADHTKRFSALVTIKNYTDRTNSGLLNQLQQLPIEMIITQSFRFHDALSTKKSLKNQQTELLQSEDDSVSQTEQLSDSLDEAASGNTSFGLHHLSVLCFADDLSSLDKHVAEIITSFSKLDMIAIRETVAMECGFWAQLPGNFAYIVREAIVSTKNLAGFMSLHNSAIGKFDGNFWGPAVSVLETLSGSPYYFNFHYKDVGNTLCFGSMGSGKTTVIGFLLLQSLKFGGKRIVFDKDHGLEILIRAIGGHYEVLKPGSPTGFNPCHLEDTHENRNFLFTLLKQMLTQHNATFNEKDAEDLRKAIEGLYSLAFEDRTLENIAPFFGLKTSHSLRARLSEWYGNGAYAWAFGNSRDELKLTQDVMGFELGKILDHEETKTPVLMYLMHRVTQALEGHRGGIFMDESWRALMEQYFEKVINDLGRTPRKKNNFLCLATQAAEDIAKKSISKALSESASCKIFFPNPQASRETYIDAFGLTEREYEWVRTMDNDARYFLLNFGHGKESVIVRVNLQGLEDEIAVISGRESTVKLLNEIRAEVGDDPSVWLPHFYERRSKV